MPSSFFECCTLLFEVMMRKLIPSIWKEKWKKVNQSCNFFFIYMIQTTQKNTIERLFRMGFQVGKKQLFNNCFHICIHCNTCLVRYCKDNKGSITQSSTTPFFQNLSAKALHVSKPQDTECVGKPDTKSPPFKLWPSQFFTSVERIRGWRKQV